MYKRLENKEFNSVQYGDLDTIHSYKTSKGAKVCGRNQEHRSLHARSATNRQTATRSASTAFLVSELHALLSATDHAER